MESTAFSEEQVAALDDRYFDLEEAGEIEASREAFYLARLISAKLAFDARDVDGALYEYRHSVDGEYSKDVIRDLESAECDGPASGHGEHT